MMQQLSPGEVLHFTERIGRAVPGMFMLLHHDTREALLCRVKVDARATIHLTENLLRVSCEDLNYCRLVGVRIDLPD